MSLATGFQAARSEAVGPASVTAALCVALVVLLSLFMPWRAGDNSDVSWIIVICEKLLDGQKLYVDIMETNPPFSVALYFGPVWLAGKLGVSAELMVQCFVYLVFFAALALSVAVIERGRMFRDLLARWIYPALAVLLLFLPGSNFGQREHLGMMLFMPMLFLMMWRADSDVRPPLGLAVLVGLAASVLMMVKPHWALGIALPYLVICWRRHSVLACVTVENVVIGVVCASYLALALLFFPEFFDKLLPLLVRYYMSLHSHGHFLVVFPAFVAFMAFIALQMRKAGWRLDVLVALASALGFFISMVYLGKYWGNHQYPYQVAMLTGMLVAIGARCRRIGEVDRKEAVNIRIHAATAFAVIASLAVSQQFDPRPEQRLADAIKSRYEAPSILQVSSDLAVGTPLTRMANGRWLTAYAQDWLGAHALWGLMQGWFKGEDEVRARKDLDDYTSYLNAIVRDEKPDIILFDRMDKTPSWREPYRHLPPIWVVWMRENPEFQRLMGDYEEIAKGDYIEVFARKHTAGSAAVTQASSPASASD
jgi:hypothetical protein